MFVLFFAIFIFLFTVFENIFIVSAWFAVCILAIVIARRFNYLRVSFLAFVLAIASVWVYNYRQGVQLSGSVFIGTGQMLTRQWQGKYLVTDWNITYLLVSQSDYQIADNIRIVGNTKMTNNTFTPSSVLSFPSAKIFSGLFNYSFNYDKRLKMKWIQWTIFEQNSIPLQNANSKIWFIDSLRIWLQNLVKASYGNGKTAGLVLGMLIGDKSQIPQSDYQSFIDSGLVHLIAVSGGNIIMIVVFLGFILLRLPFYLRNFLILLCIIIYGFLCGMDSSVFRAVIMWGLGMVALFRGRQIDIRRSLIVAFVGMLLYNPYYLVYDVGFLFSFSAIIGLIYFWKIERASRKKSTNPVLVKIQIWRSYIRSNYLSPSVWATLGILPTMIFFMGKINLLGVIGNLFVLPIIPFVMIYGFISTVLYQIFPRPGFLQIEERLIRYVYRVSEQVGNFWLYMNVEGDRIKYLILATAILRFILQRLKSFKTQEKTARLENEKRKLGIDEFINL